MGAPINGHNGIWTYTQSRKFVQRTTTDLIAKGFSRLAEVYSMYSQKSGLYRSLEFEGGTYDAIFNEELQWLMMEGQALLASERMGLWVDTSEREASTVSVSPSPQPTEKEPAVE
jgi:hypothetical protein